MVLGGLIASTLIVLALTFTCTMASMLVFSVLFLLGLTLFAVRLVVHSWAVSVAAGITSVMPNSRQC